MNTEEAGPSGYDGIRRGKYVNNNVPIRTGEEFSVDFVQDPFAPKPSIPNISQKKPVSHFNQIRHTKYEDLKEILGLKRMESDCESYASQVSSAKGLLEIETGTCIDKSKRFNKGDGSLGSNTTGYISESPQSGKLRFLCSFGGKILPRPSDGKLRYVGGETRIISTPKSLSLRELQERTRGICNQSHTIKYQLPDEDLDALISVSSDEDLQNMIEEYYGIGRLEGSQRLRIFLIPLCESEPNNIIDLNSVEQSSPDLQYVVAINGMFDTSPRKDFSRTNSDQKLNFHKDSPTFSQLLEINNCLGVSNHNQFLNNAQNQSSQFSPNPVQHGDFWLDPTLLNENNSLRASKDTNCSFITAPLPPETSCYDSPDYLHLPNGGLHWTNPSPSKQVNVIPSNRPYGVQFQICNPSSEFDQNEIGFDKNPCERPLLRERVFKSENLISFHEDQMSHLSSDSINNRGMPHAYSDSQLQEHSARPFYCSQERISPPSALHFSNPALENVDPYIPPQLPLLDIESGGSQRNKDWMKSSLLSDLSGRKEAIHRVGDDFDKNCETGKEDVEKHLIFSIKNYYEENPSNRELIVGFDEENDILQVSGGLFPASQAIDLKTSAYDNVVDRCQKEKPQLELKVKNSPMIGISNGEQKNDSWNGFSEVTGICPYAQQKSCDDSCSKDKIIQEPMLISSDDFCPSAFHDDVILKREVSLLDGDFANYSQNKVESVDPRGSSFEKLKVEDFELTETRPLSDNNELSQLESAVLLENVTHSIPPVVTSSAASVSHILDKKSGESVSPTAPDVESNFPASESLEAKPYYGDKDESINDAVIAEIEASIYGLQIIKNADLEELRELGSGTYGTVYHGKWRGSDVAIKRIKKSCFAGRSSEQERLTKDFWREAQILSNLHHPNVLAFYGVVPDGSGGTLATVTEFMANGSLRHVLLKKDRSLDGHKKLIIAMDAAFGMEYLHSKNIVHFDLKCDNLLVNLSDSQRPICKVGDFGLSRIKRNTLVSGGVRGTLPWMAPELLSGSTTRVSEKVDVFSFGIAMWEILTGEEPYANMHCGAIIGGIMKNTLRPPIPEKSDPAWRKLMEECWSPDPESRPSFAEITNRLRSMALHSKGNHNQARENEALKSQVK